MIYKSPIMTFTEYKNFIENLRPNYKVNNIHISIPLIKLKFYNKNKMIKRVLLLI